MGGLTPGGDARQVLGPVLAAAVEALVAGKVEEAFAEHAESEQRRPGSPYLTIAEAAVYLRCSRQRVDDLLSSRRLTRVKEGARTLVLRDELERYLVRHPRRPT